MLGKIRLTGRYPPLVSSSAGAPFFMALASAARFLRAAFGSAIYGR